MPTNTASNLNLRLTVYCSLFTAFIIIGAYISIPIPIGPVPIVPTDFFVMLAGLFLGWKHGLVSVALYLFLGALGMPVFAGGRAGLAVFFGPTGGFLFGYLMVVASIGFITSKLKPSMSTYLLALLVGNILLYLIGVPWLKVVANLSWRAAYGAGLAPFIVGIVIKIVAAAALAQALLPQFRQAYISADIRQAHNEDE